VQAGARAVFAPAVPIPDREAEAFFAALRARLEAGATPAAALAAEREAWLARDPRSWTQDVLLFE
jgi:hypothetical protein